MAVKRLLLVLALAAPLGLVGHAAAQGHRGVDWAESWEDAVEEAQARNAPIFITFHQDH